MQVERVHLDDGGFDELYEAVPSPIEMKQYTGTSPLTADAIVLKDGERSITISVDDRQLSIRSGDAVTERLERGAE